MPTLLDHALHGQRVDDRAEHAHVVGGRALDPGRGQRAAADDVAAADHQAQLDAHAVRRRRTSSASCRRTSRSWPELALAQQRLARHLEQDAAEAGRRCIVRSPAVAHAIA